MARQSALRSILVPLLVGLPAILVAQSSTTSGLTGTVRDPQGRAIPAATVRISSAALIAGEKVIRAEANGQYRFAALPPGLYKVTVTAPGFPVVSGVEVLELGKATTSNYTLLPPSATVEVVARVADLDSAPTGVSQNFPVDTIAGLPTASRSLSDILNLTPGVNAGSAWGGTGKGANAYMMDGINVGDPSGGTQWIYTNLDWFEEIQVGGVGANAEYGGFTGGYLNTIVKRGGNAFSGSVSSYYDSTSMQARSGNKDWAWSPGDKDVPAARNYDLSLNVGGPIVKDKVWFFVSAERENNETTNIGSNEPRQIKSNRFLGKVTWQATASGVFEAMLEYDNRDIQHKYTVESFGIYEPAAGGYQTSPSRYFTTTWTETLGQATVLTAKLNGFNGGYDVLPYNGTTPSLYLDSTPYVYNNVDLLEHNKRDRYSTSLVLDHFKTGLFTPGDSHAFKVGVEVEQASVQTVDSNPGGWILHASSAKGDGLPPYTTKYAQTLLREDVKERLDRSAAYVQDTWVVNERLSLMPGLRYESFQMRPFGSGNLWNTSTLAPRLGASYALASDLRQVLKFHWGRYFTGANADFVDRSIPGAYPNDLRYTWAKGTTFTDIHNPPAGLVNPASGTPRGVAGYASIDPKARQPYIDETTLSFETKVGADWAATATWIYRQWHQILIHEDLLQTLETGHQIYDPVGARQIAISDYTNYDPSSQDWTVTNSDRAKRAYTSLTLALDRPLRDGWSLNASYTHARSYGNSSDLTGRSSLFDHPNNQINADGILGGTPDNEIKLRSVYELPSTRTRFSLTFSCLQGVRWTRTVHADFYDAGGNYYGDIFAEPRGSEKYPTLSELDLRISQTIRLSPRITLEPYVDIFNVFNWGATTSYQSQANSNIDPDTASTGVYQDYKKPLSWQDPRKIRVGFRLKF